VGSISFASLANVFRIPDIRRKVMFTFLMLAIYRVGSFVTVPGLDQKAVADFFNDKGGSIFNLLNLWTGGGLSNAAIFGLGIMPYITASIIVQLLTVVVPTLEKLQKEGEMGYVKINRITRYLTVLLAVLQSIGYFFLFRTSGFNVIPADVNLLSTEGAARFLLVVISMTAGTVLLMWIGELITQRGIGNGISLLIFASILSGFTNGWQAWINQDIMQRVMLPLLIVASTMAVVFIQEGQRRIPVQYAKRMVGRRMTQGGSTYLPLRVNMAGVIPIIFATALMAFPATMAQYAPQGGVGDGIRKAGEFLAPGSYTGLSFEVLLIVMFTYFYTLVQFNPVDQADNLKKYGGFIPGVRPGAPTAHYLSRVLTRLTFPGAMFLAAIVALPTILVNAAGFSQSVTRGIGGTTILIVVGVALDSMRQMESQLVMRNYEGFLKQ
jgi:preprotein translocase subunit SecY